MITEEQHKALHYKPLKEIKMRPGLTRFESILYQYNIPKNRFIREMGYNSDQFYYAMNLKFTGKRKVDVTDVHLMILAFKNLGLEVKVDQLGLETKELKLG